MKKKLLIILLSLSCTSSFAQTLAYRKENENAFAASTNFLFTNFFGKYDTGVALSVISPKQAGDKKYILGLYSQGYGETSSQENSRAVFKTFSGSIVTLVQSNAYDSLNRKEHLGDYKSNTWALKVYYDIAEEVLNTLMNEGVAILRIETLAGIREYTYDKDYLGGFLRSELDLINEKKSFENDF